MKYIGIDLSKRKFSTVCLNQKGKVLYKMDFSIMKEDLEQFIESLEKSDKVAFEAGSNAQYFYRLIRPHVDEVIVVNTYAFKVIKNSIKKSDLNDAHLLARFLRYGELPSVYMPEEIFCQLRGLLGFREKLVNMKTQQRNIITAALQKEGILITRKNIDNLNHRVKLLDHNISDIGRIIISIALRNLSMVEEELKSVEAGLKKIAYEDEGIFLTVKKLIQIPGVGELTAIMIIAEIGGNISRFKTKKEIASYAGLINRTNQSGDNIKHRKAKCGRSKLKRILMQVIFAQTGRYQNPITDYYACKKKEKCIGIAVMAAARKLLTVIYIMLKYDKDYNYIEKKLYISKLKKLYLDNVLPHSHTCSNRFDT